MKHKLLTFALMGAFASTMLFSCKNAEEPIPFPGDNNSGEFTEYIISVNVPEVLRTRDASTEATSATIGESGIYEFPTPEINRLYYYVYYDGEYKTGSSIGRDNSNPFKFTITLGVEDDPSKYEFAFLATNNSGAVDISSSTKMLNVEESKLNGIVPDSYYASELNFKVNDAFFGFYRLSETNDKSIRNVSFTLKRPFAEFHVLCDDFMETTSDLYKDYPSGITTYVGFGSEAVDRNNYKSTLVMPVKYSFDSASENSLQFKEPTDLEFYNNLTSEAKKVTFKGRKMHYLTCFYALAPFETEPLHNGDLKLDRLNIVICNGKSSKLGNGIVGNNKYISIPLPEEGIKANTKYIIYNKSLDDGGTGWVDGKWTFEISVKEDPAWDEPNSENEVDKL